MNKIPNVILMLPLVGALLFGGCGGGDPFSVAEGGIGGTGISTGTVTGIGSITVNGVEFNTYNAAIYIEGVRVDDPNLADGTGIFLLGKGFSEGQVVRVVGTFNADGKTGTAGAVYYNDSVEGPVASVTAIDVNTSEIIVMGQTIIMDSQTVLEGAPDVSINDVIEVSGLRDDAGKIRAGYIRNITVSGQDPDLSIENEIKGIIGTVPGNSRFTIESLTIDYTNADMTDIPDGIPVVGMQVEVKGTFIGGELVATRVEMEDDISGNDDDDVEYEGIVTNAPVPFAIGNSFVMGVQIVQTSSNTAFKGGLVEDITAGVRLEVEGYLQGDTLIADEVRFNDVIEIDAPVANHSLVSGVITIELIGLTPPITVQVNNISKIEGDASTVTQLDNRLSSGDPDYVEVRGRLISSGLIYAEEIKIEAPVPDDPPKIKLQGLVEDISFPSIQILGIAINTDQISEFEAIDDSTNLSQAEFFNILSLNNVVSAEGEWNGVSVDWDKLELEDEE